MNFHEEVAKYRIIHIREALEKAFNEGVEWCMIKAESFDGEGLYLQHDVKLAFENYIKKTYGVEI